MCIRDSHLAGAVDGLFLGRFAHDIEALAQVVHEVSADSAAADIPTPIQEATP